MAGGHHPRSLMSEALSKPTVLHLKEVLFLFPLATVLK